MNETTYKLWLAEVEMTSSWLGAELVRSKLQELYDEMYLARPPTREEEERIQILMTKINTRVANFYCGLPVPEGE